MYIGITVCTLLLSASSIQALPAGERVLETGKIDNKQPLSVCQSLTPFHSDRTTNEPIKPQTDPSPYTITASKSDIKPHEIVEVIIQGNYSTTFEGFMVQARNDGKPYGKFTKNNSIALLDCLGGKENTATTRIQPNKEDMSKVRFIWTAPAELPDSIEFIGTIVKDYDTFWVNQKSGKLNVKKEA